MQRNGKNYEEAQKTEREQGEEREREKESMKARGNRSQCRESLIRRICR